MDSNVKTEKYLNSILEKTYDAQRGYANASEVTNHVDLKRWFAKQGAKRTQYAAAIADQMKGMNESPEFDGSFKGDVHRGWMNFKTALSSNKDESILEECIRGEKAAVEEYKEVLEHKEQLPQSVVSILESQKAEIQNTVEKIKRLEDVAAHLNE